MENAPLEIIDRETVSRLLSHCADPAGVITEPFGDTMYDLASRIKKTREEQAVQPYTEADLRYLLHMSVLSTTAHKGQTRQTGEGYFEAHLVGTDRNLIEELGRTRVSLLGGGLGHDLKEQTSIVDKNRFRDAWKGTFKNSNDPVLLNSEKIFKRIWDLISVSTKMKRNTRAETAAGAVRTVLSGFRELGFDVVHLKGADRLDNMRTIGVKEEKRRREIVEETYEVYCRIGDIIGIRHYVRTCVDLCAPVLNPSLLKDFTELRDGRMREHLRRRFLIEDASPEGVRMFSIQEYLTSLFDGMEGFVHAEFERAPLADFVLESDEPLGALSLDKLSISSLNPLFETVILVKPGTDIHSIITHLIRNCAEPGERWYTENANPAGEFPKLGIRLTIHSRRLGILIFRMNDTVSEARSKRGASPIRSEAPQAVDLPSDDMRAAVRRILNETQGSRVARTIPLARAFLLRPNMTVYTPRGDPKSLLKGSRGPDFAASVHLDFLHGFDRLIAHDSEKRFHEINPFDPLEEGMQIEIVPGEQFRPDPGWLLFCETERARVALKKILSRRSEEDYLLRIARLFGLSRERVAGDDREPVGRLAEGLFKEKSVWKIRVELPDEPGILRAFLGEFEKQGINVNRFTHIPRPAPALHIIRMTIEDHTGEKTPFDMMKALLKLSYHYRVAVLPQNFFRRTMRRAGDFLSIVRNTLRTDILPL